MATSYTNSGGSGNRTALITVTISTTGSVTGTPSTLVNGNTAENVLYFNTVWPNPAYIRFQFLTSKIINEVKFYQSGASDHGTWQWQGSNNGSTWTSIGTSFNLGVSTLQTQTSMSGNTTGYTYYQLIPVAPFGQFQNIPYVREFEFKIDDFVAVTTKERTYLSVGLG